MNIMCVSGVIRKFLPILSVSDTYNIVFHRFSYLMIILVIHDDVGLQVKVQLSYGLIPASLQMFKGLLVRFHLVWILTKMFRISVRNLFWIHVEP